MAAAAATSTRSHASRLLAVHPLCPMVLQHNKSWNLANYKTVSSSSSVTGAELNTATSTICGASVQLHVIHTVSVDCAVSDRRLSQAKCTGLSPLCRARFLKKIWTQ